MKALLIGAALVAAIVIGERIISGQPSTDDQVGETEMQSEQVGEEEQAREIEIEAGGFYFNPNEIRVKTGERVRIIIRSVSMMHNFTIDELGVESEIIQDGNIGTVEFVADRAGEFEYYCGVSDHRQRGQMGTLIVED